MQAVTIPIKDEPKARKDSSGQDLQLTSWEIQQLKTLKVYNDSMPKAYIHLYNQCSTNLKNDLEAATAFAQVESAKDPI
jgi:hypothetical protein